MNIRIPTLNTAVWIALAVALLFIVLFIYWVFSGTSVTVINSEQSRPVSPLTGRPCAGATQRPIAVMLASDPEARPLSGIGQADMVFEMPVTPNGITRMMAVYQCAEPKEIGSVRSARQDFIPLAQGIDSIFAHWGGERDALDELNAHAIDNVDALLYEGSTFYRKQGIARPHNGFTTLTLIRERIEQLGYRSSTSMQAYPHVTDETNRTIGSLAEAVTVPWPQGMDVRFSYDEATNTYARWRGGTPEIDAATGTQVRVAVVIILQTTATFLRDQYISVRTLGTGEATLYQGGRRISAHWKKLTPTDMLVFTDSQGRMISLHQGPVWIVIDAPLPAVSS